MPPRITLEEIRTKPWYSEKLEKWYLSDPNRRDWTPIKAQMIGERIIFEEWMRGVKKRKQFSEEQIQQDAWAYPGEAFRDTIEGLQEPPAMIGALAGRVVTTLTPPIVGSVVGHAVNKSVTKGLKKVEKEMRDSIIEERTGDIPELE